VPPIVGVSQRLTPTRYAFGGANPICMPRWYSALRKMFPTEKVKRRCYLCLRRELVEKYNMTDVYWRYHQMPSPCIHEATVLLPFQIAYRVVGLSLETYKAPNFFPRIGWGLLIAQNYVNFHLIVAAYKPLLYFVIKLAWPFYFLLTHSPIF
jgi:hypothetical protein